MVLLLVCSMLLLSCSGLFDTKAAGSIFKGFAGDAAEGASDAADAAEIFALQQEQSLAAKNTELKTMNRLLLKTLLRAESQKESEVGYGEGVGWGIGQDVADLFKKEKSVSSYEDEAKSAAASAAGTAQGILNDYEDYRSVTNTANTVANDLNPENWFLEKSVGWTQAGAAAEGDNLLNVYNDFDNNVWDGAQKEKSVGTWGLAGGMQELQDGVNLYKDWNTKEKSVGSAKEKALAAQNRLLRKQNQVLVKALREATAAKETATGMSAYDEAFYKEYGVKL